MRAANHNQSFRIEEVTKPYRIESGTLKGWWRIQTNAWSTLEDTEEPGGMKMVYRFDTGEMRVYSTGNGHPQACFGAIMPDDGDLLDDSYAAEAHSRFIRMLKDSYTDLREAMSAS